MLLLFYQTPSFPSSIYLQTESNIPITISTIITKGQQQDIIRKSLQNNDNNNNNNVHRYMRGPTNKSKYMCN